LTEPIRWKSCSWAFPASGLIPAIFIELFARCGAVRAEDY
jgi:hypothetical protein